MMYGFTVTDGITTNDYYYVHNLQGDVIRIVDSTGTVVVYYSYDPWGEMLSITGTLATTLGRTNPIRYRGYYYDTETGFYYCRSRYYDPEICRWINADGYISTGQGLLSFNMFVYCGNNPIVFYDPSGLCYIAYGCIEMVECEYAATYAGEGVVAKCGKLLAEEQAHSSSGWLSDAQMQDNARIVTLYLFENGWNYNAICAVLGNMQAESKINPGMNEIKGNGYGLVQWTPPHKYLNWASSHGYKADSMLGQLEFLLYSMQPGRGEWFQYEIAPEYYLPYSEFIVSYLPIEYLTLVFMWSYERPLTPHTEKRISYALKWDCN